MQIGVANSGAELTSTIGDNRTIHDNRSGVSRVKVMYWEIRTKFRSTIPGRTHRSPDGTRRQMAAVARWAPGLWTSIGSGASLAARNRAQSAVL